MNLDAITRRLANVVERWGGHLPPVTWATDTAQYVRAMVDSGATTEYASNLATDSIAIVMDGVTALHVGPKITGIVERIASQGSAGPVDAALAVRALSHELSHVATPMVSDRTVVNNGQYLCEGIAEFAATRPTRIEDIARAIGLAPTPTLVDDASKPMRSVLLDAGLFPRTEGATHPYDRLRERVAELVALAGDDPSRALVTRFHGGTVESARARLVDDIARTHGIPESQHIALDRAIGQWIVTRHPEPLTDVLAKLALTPTG